MEEIKNIIEGYNKEKLLLQEANQKVGNYTGYDKPRIEQNIKRILEIDTRLQEILNKVLPTSKPNNI